MGSFLNSLVYRLEIAETLMGRSHCPQCRAKIRWYDNVPLLSFLMLQGKCRDCEQKISWQYPLVEVITGIVFLLVGKYFFVLEDTGAWIDTAFYLFSFSALMAIFVYDFKFMEIPMIVIWTGVVAALVYALYFDWSNFYQGMDIFQARIFSGILGGGIAFLFFFFLVWVSKERWMGMGDAYLGILVGLIVGWPLVLMALFLAFTLGALFGIGLILLKKKTLQSQVPFAPFLATGAFLAVIFSQLFVGSVYFNIG